MTQYTKREIVLKVLRDRTMLPRHTPPVFAPANIALCKYWGKRDTELNLPVTGSLSVSLGSLGTHTEIASACDSDTVVLNGAEVDEDSPFRDRVIRFLNLFRPRPLDCYMVTTQNTVPTAAGLASSASGFAALVRALDRFYRWDLQPHELSILSRLGSGSACRSVFNGFVEWQSGCDADGMDSFAVSLSGDWPYLRIGVLMIDTAEKGLSSGAAMRQTVETSALYRHWPERVANDLAEIKAAIEEKDFERLGRAAETNALAMHATMLLSRPPVLYWQASTVEALHRVWRLRSDGLPVYMTMDAGPNVILLFLEDSTADLQKVFADMTVVQPFP